MQKITLQRDRGIRGKSPIDAWEKGGLCVCKTLAGKKWTVAHVASGAQIYAGATYAKRKDAEAALDRLLALPVNWGLGEHAIGAELKANLNAVHVALGSFE